MQILEELWYGNISPIEQFVQGDGEYFAALQKADAIRDTFPPEMMTAVFANIKHRVQLELHPVGF